MMIFDAHLDLSLNALEYNRDLSGSLEEIRAGELGMCDLAGRGGGTVSFGEMRKAGIGVCVATQIAGCMKPAGPVASWSSPAQAWAMTQGQLAWYQAMEDAGLLRQIRSEADLDDQLRAWSAAPESAAIGYVLSLEGADSLRTLADLETAYAYGLRALGPAHYGSGRYALGHDRSGPLSAAGRELLHEMQRLGLILDLTHLSEESFWEALGRFDGSVWASHHNCRALVDDPRQLGDEQVVALAERGGVIGLALDAWMIVPGWERGVSTPEGAGVTIERAVDHMDHICQLLGNARHVGIGSDLDGGFGKEQCPQELESIAGLPKILDCLRRRGYAEADITGIAHGNFIRLLRQGLG